MKPGVWNIEISQDGDWTPTLTCVDELTGVPEDLTGFDIFMDICDGYGTAPKITLSSNPAAGIVNGGVAGTIAFTLRKADIVANLSVPDTPGIPPTKKYVHSVRLVQGAVTIPYLVGAATVARKTGV